LFLSIRFVNHKEVKNHLVPIESVDMKWKKDFY